MILFVDDWLLSFTCQLIWTEHLKAFLETFKYRGKTWNVGATIPWAGETHGVSVGILSPWLSEERLSVTWQQGQRRRITAFWQSIGFPWLQWHPHFWLWPGRLALAFPREVGGLASWCTKKGSGSPAHSVSSLSTWLRHLGSSCLWAKSWGREHKLRANLIISNKGHSPPEQTQLYYFWRGLPWTLN